MSKKINTPNIVSKSNGTEIISVLYFILATQVHYKPLHILLLVMGAENMLESMLWSFIFRENKAERPGMEKDYQAKVEASQKASQ